MAHVSSDEDLIHWLENKDMTMGAALRLEVAARLRALSGRSNESKEIT